MKKTDTTLPAYFQQIVQAFPGFVFWQDLSNVFLGCNHHFAIAAGFQSSDDIIGKTFKDLPWLDKAKYHETINGRVLETSKKEQFEEHFITSENVQSVFMIEKTVLKDEENQPIGVLTFATDISERKATEEKYRSFEKHVKDQELERKINLMRVVKNLTGDNDIHHLNTVEEHVEYVKDYLENIIALMPGHVYWFDRNIVYLGCNDNQANNLSLKSRKDIVGKTTYDLAPDDQAEMLNVVNRKVMETGETHVAEEAVTMANGTRIYLSHKVPLKNNMGEVIGALGISLDITERKEAEEALKIAKEKAEAANLAKSEFIMNMSHDIRTPFNGILGYSQILASKEEDKEKKQQLNHIVQSSIKLLDFLNEVIDLAQIEKKQSELKIETFEIRKLFNDVHDIIKPYLKKKGLTFHIACSEEIPKEIVSDRYRLHRILLNLLGNAIKFTHVGRVDLTINVINKDNKSNLQIIIEDTGIGIPSDKFKEIFNYFSRLIPSYKETYKGTGLGLYITKKFIENMGGDIFVSSEEGVGTTFTCHVPFALPNSHIDQINNLFPQCQDVSSKSD